MNNTTPFSPLWLWSNCRDWGQDTKDYFFKRCSHCSCCLGNSDVIWSCELDCDRNCGLKYKIYIHYTWHNHIGSPNDPPKPSKLINLYQSQLVGSDRFRFMTQQRFMLPAVIGAPRTINGCSYEEQVEGRGKGCGQQTCIQVPTSPPKNYTLSQCAHPDLGFFSIK